MSAGFDKIRNVLAYRLLILGAFSAAVAFQNPTPRRIFPKPFVSPSSLDNTKFCLYARKTLTKERSFDPCNFASEAPSMDPLARDFSSSQQEKNQFLDKAGLSGATAGTALAMLTGAADKALAATDSIFVTGKMDPNQFQPVCPASDGFYRFLQTSTVGVIGKDAFVEYGPLIAGGLLRVRLELCVVESFFNEAIGPFIAENGLNWVLPLHETVETFLAGTIFAFASTFILIGSTKIISVVATYTDFIFGLPSRILGGFFFDRASGKKVTLDVGLGPFKTRLIGPPDEDVTGNITFLSATWPQRIVLAVSGLVKYFGVALGFVRSFVDGLDVFVGRYLLLWSTGYVILKFLHYKIFPDFP